MEKKRRQCFDNMLNECCASVPIILTYANYNLQYNFSLKKKFQYNYSTKVKWKGMYKKKELCLQNAPS